MNSIKMERINFVINENFIKNNDCLTDVYLINGIKMTSYMSEVEAGKYLLLKDRITLTENTIGHLVCWSTVVTINRGPDQSKIHKNLDNGNKIIVTSPWNKEHLFVNKEIYIYLSNGIKLDGLCVVIDNGNYIILEKNGNQQIILWHGITTMSLVVNRDGEQLLAHKGNKNTNILMSFLDQKVAVFLKTGIKLQGILTDFFDEGDTDKNWELVLDNKQLIRMQHVSTITENKN